jgi:hypothetical protein
MAWAFAASNLLDALPAVDSLLQAPASIKTATTAAVVNILPGFDIGDAFMGGIERTEPVAVKRDGAANTMAYAITDDVGRL